MYQEAFARFSAAGLVVFIMVCYCLCQFWSTHWTFSFILYQWSVVHWTNIFWNKNKNTKNMLFKIYVLENYFSKKYLITMFALKIYISISYLFKIYGTKFKKLYFRNLSKSLKIKHKMIKINYPILYKVVLSLSISKSQTQITCFTNSLLIKILCMTHSVLVKLYVTKNFTIEKLDIALTKIVTKMLLKMLHFLNCDENLNINFNNFFEVDLQAEFLENTKFLQKLFSLNILVFNHGS